MSRIHPDEVFRRAVRGGLYQMGIEQHDLAVFLGVCDGTVSLMLKNPGKNPLDRLRKIIVYLNLEPDVVLKSLGYTAKKIKE